MFLVIKIYQIDFEVLIHLNSVSIILWYFHVHYDVFIKKGELTTFSQFGGHILPCLSLNPDHSALVRQSLGWRYWPVGELNDSEAVAGGNTRGLVSVQVVKQLLKREPAKRICISINTLIVKNWVGVIWGFDIDGFDIVANSCVTFVRVVQLLRLNCQRPSVKIRHNEALIILKKIR